MKKVIAALIAFAAIALPQSAIAGVYDAPHKWTDAFGKTRIYIPGNADTVVDVITESSKEYSFSLNGCGWISLRESSTRKIKSVFIPSNGITVSNFASPNITYQHEPLCTWNSTNGWSFWEMAANVNRPNGNLWQITGTLSYWIKIKPALQGAGGIQGIVTYENTIKNKINSCGFGLIIVSATRPMTTFKIAGISYSLAALPFVTKPQICRIQSGVKMRYIPL